VRNHDRKSPPPSRGRPRSDQSRQAIRQAALDLLTEIGYPRMTIEGIAARAGTGKQTIYRWWRTKADVVLEAINTSASREIPLPETGSLRSDLLAFLNATFAAGRRPGILPVLRSLMAEAQLDPGFGAAFDGLFLQRRREALSEVLRRHPGELGDVPVPVAVAVVFGTMWYRILASHRPLNATLARELTDLLTP
jgi:AcrR family transcriptional regulator